MGEDGGRCALLCPHDGGDALQEGVDVSGCVVVGGGGLLARADECEGINFVFASVGCSPLECRLNGGKCICWDAEEKREVGRTSHRDAECDRGVRAFLQDFLHVRASPCVIP